MRRGVSANGVTRLYQFLMKAKIAFHTVAMEKWNDNTSRQNKKALFGGLSKTVKFLHLLRALVVDIKNPFLISDISI